MDGEVLGVITLWKMEQRAFEEVDLTFLQVLASQTVVAIKNARLMEERERRVVAEERNRLAREIHDGIAQSFAGVLMKVESSLKVFDSRPEQVRKWLEESQVELRDGLKEVRHSITALRPSPAARIGLIPALRRRVEAFESETGAEGIFEIRGEKVPSMMMRWKPFIWFATKLSPMRPSMQKPPAFVFPWIINLMKCG